MKLMRSLTKISQLGWLLLASLLGSVSLPPGALAADASDITPLESVTVRMATPLGGLSQASEPAPFSVEVLDQEAMGSTGRNDPGAALSARLSAVSLSDNLDDPYQLDILYRGFEASPVLGTSQGLAVFQNGTRINEGFGDTLNFDLVPDNAVKRMEIASANPLYGLNALGGAVILHMKSGFDSPGLELSASGGSFGRHDDEFALGRAWNNLGVFFSARDAGWDGWRKFSADLVRQMYGALDYRDGAADLQLSYSWAQNRLRGEGATPVQTLAVARDLTFTAPQEVSNRLDFLQADYKLAHPSGVSAELSAYVRRFRQGVVNGNTTPLQGCTAPGLAGALCQTDGVTPAATTGGATIPDLSNGGQTPLGEIDTNAQHTLSYGLDAQIEHRALLFGLQNLSIVGAAVDAANTDYRSDSQVGVVGPGLWVTPAPYALLTPEGGAFTATPVFLKAQDQTVSLYATDTLDVTSRLSLTLSARAASMRIDLSDQRGQSLDGLSRYKSFNPSLGLTYQLMSGLGVYGDYAQSSRAPTPSEIECSNAAAPCLLPSSLSSDPPSLKQVVARSFEGGFRSQGALGDGAFSASFSLYATRLRNDIYPVATSLSTGFFENIAGTTRRGADLSFRFEDNRLSAFISASIVRAAFAASFVEPSPANPLSDAQGALAVSRGDALPGVPKGRLKSGVMLHLSRRLALGADAQWVDRQYYHGDEANRLKPLPGYAVLNLHCLYQVTDSLALSLNVANALDAHYATYGVLGDPSGVGAPGVPTEAARLDPRFQSPAAPFAASIALGGRF